MAPGELGLSCAKDSLREGLKEQRESEGTPGSGQRVLSQQDREDKGLRLPGRKHLGISGRPGRTLHVCVRIYTHTRGRQAGITLARQTGVQLYRRRLHPEEHSP